MTALSPATIDFLSDLRANNERAWFEAHKAEYERAYKRPAEHFAPALASALAAATGEPHDHRLFRIHRDMRFSPDKRPYHAYLRIALSPGGGCRDGGPVWMAELDPEGLTVGIGIFGFSPPQIEAWRALVDGEKGASVAAMIERLGAEGVRIGEPDLKRVPAPFAADHPRASLLQGGLTAVVTTQLLAHLFCGGGLCSLPRHAFD